MSEYVVPVEPVFATTTEYEPLPVFLSISYPVMTEPPLFDGAVQLKLICGDDVAVALRLVGEPGTVDGDEPETVNGGISCVVNIEPLAVVTVTVADLLPHVLREGRAADTR